MDVLLDWLLWGNDAKREPVTGGGVRRNEAARFGVGIFCPPAEHRLLRDMRVFGQKMKCLGGHREGI